MISKTKSQITDTVLQVQIYRNNTIKFESLMVEVFL